MKPTAGPEFLNLVPFLTVSVNKIAKLLGGDKVFITKRPGEPDRSLADIKKIKKDLKWKPKISIETGISKLLSNINHWKTAPVWSPRSIKEATKGIGV